MTTYYPQERTDDPLVSQMAALFFNYKRRKLLPSSLSHVAKRFGRDVIVDSWTLFAPTPPYERVVEVCRVRPGKSEHEEDLSQYDDFRVANRPDFKVSGYQKIIDVPDLFAFSPATIKDNWDGLPTDCRSDFRLTRVDVETLLDADYLIPESMSRRRTKLYRLYPTPAPIAHDLVVLEQTSTRGTAPVRPELRLWYLHPVGGWRCLSEPAIAAGVSVGAAMLSGVAQKMRIDLGRSVAHLFERHLSFGKAQEDLQPAAKVTQAEWNDDTGLIDDSDLYAPLDNLANQAVQRLVTPATTRTTTTQEERRQKQLEATKKKRRVIFKVRRAGDKGLVKALREMLHQFGDVSRDVDDAITLRDARKALQAHIESNQRNAIRNCDKDRETLDRTDPVNLPRRRFEVPDI